MANIKSALKRIKLTQRNTLRNKVSTSMMRTYIKLFITSCEEYQNSPSEDKLKSLKQDLDIACSKVDKAKNQGILHKNTAMRKKSTLQSIYNKLFVKSI
jgi:small subunit ribosomal protein S20|uniref:Small ribosomal subunit protein bS20c n=1 Tax=Octactis speculum TaxID=3111310 RepID=A0A514CPP4_9STRA|nr:ribosomal protein S20 [Dictyocha speculum]QDH81778.1 ribosomal protein S20 [Dictyocha speculum]|tara:strand:+ start:3789 stop:4085 length:297 start_codon:yes stop_codon:yes gene_type:complete